MKVCSKCGEKKRKESFAFKNKKKGKRHNYCRECRKLYFKKHYQENKEYYIKKAKESDQRLKERNRNFIFEYLLTHPCVDCGETNLILLDFDHQRNKTDSISNMMKQNGAEMIKEEISKCEVRCVKCHRLKTAKENNWHRYTWVNSRNDTPSGNGSVL